MRIETMRTMRADATRRGSFVQVLAQEVGGFKAIRAPEMHPAGSLAGATTPAHRPMIRFNAKADMWALGILLSEAILLLPIEEWYPERATMQAFGRSPELQAAKIQEVAALSAVLGNVVKKMLTKAPKHRISSAELAAELQRGSAV